MFKLLLIATFAILISGCFSSEEEYENACYEVGSTRVFEDSKRIEIFKNVGKLSSKEAVDANVGIKIVIELKKLARIRKEGPFYDYKCTEIVNSEFANYCMDSVRSAVNDDTIFVKKAREVGKACSK